MTVKNIVFIDSRVEDYETLVAALGQESAWVLLNPDEDGVLQMQSYLSNYSDLEAIHIVSHGSVGTVYVGSTILDGGNLASYETQLQAIGASLGEGGDLLLYGCDVAQGEEGRLFIDALVGATQVDVAASVDRTGFLGDALLEATWGSIEAQTIDLDGYEATLAAGSTASGTIEAAGDHDWFKMTLAANTLYALDAKVNGAVDIYKTLCIYDANGTLVGLVDGSGGVTGSQLDGGGNGQLAFMPRASGTYYVDVASMLNTTGDYTLSLAAVADDYRNNTTTSGILDGSGTVANTAPTYSDSIPNTVQAVTIGMAAALPDFTVADADGDSLTLSLTATNGTLNNLTDANSSLAGIQLQGSGAQISAALAGASFTAAAPGTASIGFSLSDGKAAAVTASYALSASASNTAPTFANSIPVTTQPVTTGVATALPDFTVADADGDSLTLTLTATNGTLNNLTDANSSLAGIQLQGSGAQISAALAGATFTAAAPGTASIGFSLSDGKAAAVTASYALSASASNTAPTFANSIPGTTQPVSPGVAAALPDFTVADADGDSLTLTLTATNGTLNNLTDANSSLAGIQLQGSGAQISAALAGATFTAAAPGAASIGLGLSDGKAAVVSATYNLNASSVADTTDGNDLFAGSSGNDLINAGAGDDTINGGSGHDTIEGGAGTDRLILDMSGSTSAVYYDVKNSSGAVSSFYAGNDFTSISAALASQSPSFGVRISNSYRSVLYNGMEEFQISGGSGNDLLIAQGPGSYAGGAGTDTFYANWGSANEGITWNNNQAAATVMGCTISGMERLLLVTGSGSDLITNILSETDDEIHTGAGDDTINGGSGRDTIDGGAGTDRLILDMSGSTTALFYDVKNSSGAVSSIYAGNDFTSISSALASQSPSFGVRISNSYRSVLYNGMEEFQISGGSGNDLLIWQGAGSYEGGAGTDTLYADWGSATQGITWNNNQASGTVMGSTVSSMERLLLVTGSGNDLVTNTLSETDDEIRTGAGADTINGGSGRDTIDGGAGIDRLILDMSGSSTALFYDLKSLSGAVNSFYAGSDFASLTAALASQSPSFGAKISNSYRSAFYNGMEEFQISGGSGNDLLIWQGAGSYAGGAGTDTFYANWGSATEGVTWNNNQASATVMGSTVSGMERLLLVTGSGNDLITNTLSETNDEIRTGAGDDTINGGLGRDTIDGGAGIDRLILDMSGSSTALFYDLKNSGGAITTLYAGSDFASVASALAGQSPSYDARISNSYRSVSYGGIEKFQISAGSGNDLLVWQGAGSYAGGAGTDTFYANWGSATEGITWNNNQTSATVMGSTVSGMERLLLATGSGNDLITNALTSTNDEISTAAGNDTINGGLGYDTIDGGSGTDRLIVDMSASNTSVYYYLKNLSGISTGLYAGSDFASITSALANPSTSFASRIMDGSGYRATSYNGFEEFQVSTGSASDLLIWQGAGSYAGGAGTDTFYANWANATVGITWNNNPAAPATMMGSTVSGMERLLLATGSGNDLIANTISTTNDEITTGSGSDTVNGGYGYDTLAGGLGNDTYIVDSGGDIIVEFANQGFDLIQSMISYSLLDTDGSGSNGGNVENLQLLGGGNINASGNALNNVLFANGGVNVIDGGDGADTVSYLYSTTTGTAGIVLNLALINGQGYSTAAGISGADLIRNIENITGSNYADALTGDGRNNILDGGAGVDTLAGGSGNDSYVVNSPSDVVSESAGQGTDLIQSWTSYSLVDTDGPGAKGGNVENLRLLGTENLNATGNALNNVLYANNGINMIDGAGGVDTVSYAYTTATGAAGVILNLSVVNSLGYSTASGASGADLIKGIENITGSNYADVLAGNDRNNILDGGTGMDTLTGGAGNDTYVVNTVSDWVVEYAGQGIDLIQSSVSCSLVDSDGGGANGGNVENLRLLGAGNVNATGNVLNNVLFANNGVNVIDGGAGLDTVSYLYASTTGTSGVTLDLSAVNSQGYATAGGISGADLIKNVENVTGSSYADRLVGNSGNNTLDGGAGNDTLTGGAGRDILAGGTGNDSFDFNAPTEMGRDNSTWDVINDFVRGQDKIDLSTLDANASTTANDAFSSVIAGSAAFTAAGQLKFASGVLYGNTDGDADAEFAIALTGITAVDVTDLIL